MSEIPKSPAGRSTFLSEVTPSSAQERHDELRAVLAAEIEYRRSDDDGEYFESLYHCAYLLFCVGDPADVPAMWSAKHIDMDTATGFDVQFMWGAGVSETDSYLRSTGHIEIADELAARSEEADELAEWSEWRESYFYGG